MSDEARVIKKTIVSSFGAKAASEYLSQMSRILLCRKLGITPQMNAILPGVRPCVS